MPKKAIAEPTHKNPYLYPKQFAAVTLISYILLIAFNHILSKYDKSLERTLKSPEIGESENNDDNNLFQTSTIKSILATTTSKTLDLFSGGSTNNQNSNDKEGLKEETDFLLELLSHVRNNLQKDNVDTTLLDQTANTLKANTFLQKGQDGEVIIVQKPLQTQIQENSNAQAPIKILSQPAAAPAAPMISVTVAPVPPSNPYIPIQQVHKLSPPQARKSPAKPPTPKNHNSKITSPKPKTPKPKTIATSPKLNSMSNSFFKPVSTLSDVLSAPICPEIYKPDFSKFVQIDSKYNSRRSHFLTSILSWGPNNQLRGLMETIVLAIKMNRTVVVPPFFRHQLEAETDLTLSFDSKYGLTTDPWMWYDLNEINKLVSVESVDKLQLRCPDKTVQALFLGKPISRGPLYERIVAFEQYTELTITKPDYTGPKKEASDWMYPKVKIEPNLKEIARLCDGLSSTSALELPMETDKIKEHYRSEMPCAVWAFPYRNFDFKQIWKYAQHPTPQFKSIAFGKKQGFMLPDYVHADDVELMIEAVNAIKPSRIVKDVTETIKRQFFHNEEYIALHWRYTNKDDASNSLKAICQAHPDKCDFYTKMLADPGKVGLQLSIALGNYAEKILKLPAGKTILIFIATPTSNKDFIKIVTESLVNSAHNNKYSYSIFTFDAVFENLKAKRRICDKTATLLDQNPSLQSNIEQQLCKQSKAFLFSFGSSWSLNVQLMRTAELSVDPKFRGVDDILDIGVVDLIVSTLDGGNYGTF